MILQSENPIRLLCELKGAKLSIVIALGLVSQRVSQEWLERATGYTDKTVSQALAYLEEYGFTTHTNAGWQLSSDQARQLVMPMQLEEENPPKPEKDNKAETSEPGQEENNLASRRISDSLNYLNTVVVEEINNINSPTTTDLNLSDKSGKIPTDEEIQKVLDAAEALFGHQIMGEARDYADIDRLISWIAQAYQGCFENGHLKIRNPAGLVYWAFHKGKDHRTEDKYIKNADQYLPDDFLRSSGQWVFEEEEDSDEH